MVKHKSFVNPLSCIVGKKECNKECYLIWLGHIPPATLPRMISSATNLSAGPCILVWHFVTNYGICGSTK